MCIRGIKKPIKMKDTNSYPSPDSIVEAFLAGKEAERKEIIEKLTRKLQDPVKAGDYWSQEWLKWLIKDLSK